LRAQAGDDSKGPVSHETIYKAIYPVLCSNRHQHHLLETAALT
jgi:hypothetical protein